MKPGATSTTSTPAADCSSSGHSSSSASEDESRGAAVPLCPICCYGMTFDSMSSTRCGHVFHHECLQKWVRLSSSVVVCCPLCNKSLRYNGQLECIRLFFSEFQADDSVEPATPRGVCSQPADGGEAKEGQVKPEETRPKSVIRSIAKPSSENLRRRMDISDSSFQRPSNRFVCQFDRKHSESRIPEEADLCPMVDSPGLFEASSSPSRSAHLGDVGGDGQTRPAISGWTQPRALQRGPSRHRPSTDLCRARTQQADVSRPTSVEEYQARIRGLERQLADYEAILAEFQNQHLVS